MMVPRAGRAARAAVLAVLAVVCLSGMAALALAAAAAPQYLPAAPADDGPGASPGPGELEVNAPRISDVSVSAITARQATITWQTDGLATSRVEYGETDSYGQSAGPVVGYAASHKVALKKLSPGTTYHFRVVSRGWWFGGTSQSGDYTFTTLEDGGDDKDPPVISGVKAESVTDSGAVITWTTDKDSDSQVEYGLTTRYGSSTPLAGALTREHALALSGLKSGTTYHYRVVSAGAAGNRARSGDLTFTTLDKAPPAIEGMVVTDVTTTGCTVIWTTSRPADSQVLYGPDAGYGSRTARMGPLATGHQVAITGLASGTTYHCQAVSRDGDGREARSEDYLFTTVDDTPPVITDVMAQSITDSSAVITWTTDSPSEGSVEYGPGDKGYRFVSAYDNTMVTSHSVALTGLAAQTTYHYKVKSRDASGLWAAAPDATFTTGVDWSATAPGIMFLTASQVTISGATISWSTDELCTSDVEYGESAQYGLRLQAESSMSMEHTAQLQDLRSGTTYHYRVRSVDAAGNETVSPDRTFTTPLQKAPLPSLPVWAWAAIGLTGALAVGVLALRNR